MLAPWEKREQERQERALREREQSHEARYFRQLRKFGATGPYTTDV